VPEVIARLDGLAEGLTMRTTARPPEVRDAAAG
jgi:hypothetical protein